MSCLLNKIVNGDCLKEIKKIPDNSFDLIFADPPYNLKNLNQIPNVIFEKKILKKNGWLIMEHGKDVNFEETTNFIERRTYSNVNFSFFKLEGEK